MKVGKPLPTVSAVQSNERRQPVPREIADQSRETRPVSSRDKAPRARRMDGAANYTIQLNRQLSSLQVSERYLARLEGDLGSLKLRLSQQLSSADAQGQGAERTRAAIEQVRALLDERGPRTGGTLGPDMDLSLNEPARVRFKLDGLDSAAALRESGRETLVLNAGSRFGEPFVVLLEDDMSDSQLLQRLNAGLGRAGIRAAIDDGGQLMFSAREGDWERFTGQLSIRGEGKLFPKDAFTPINDHPERLLSLPADRMPDTVQELRGALDSVVAALEKIARLREQISTQEQEIRRFLAQHADRDEREWARNYADAARDLLTRESQDYSAVSQTVLAQANISRFMVVSLLS